MLAVVQRVKEAEVRVLEVQAAKIGSGLVAFVGVEEGDGEEEAKYFATKMSELRVFSDSEGKMNLSLKDTGFELLLVPNFTVVGDCRKGRRPSFDRAATPEAAEALLCRLGKFVEEEGIRVGYGQFGDKMEVMVWNVGPVTVLIDSKRRL